MKRCMNTINTIMINTIKILNENQIRIKYENKDSQILTKIDNILIPHIVSKINPQKIIVHINPPHYSHSDPNLPFKSFAFMSSLANTSVKKFAALSTRLR